MRSVFDEQLGVLNQELTKMGMLCEYAIRQASEALLTHDIAMAQDVPELMDRINEEDREIESLCLRLLLRQQPVAGDLRKVSSALKMITDMRRVGVQASDIAEIVTMDSITEVDDNIGIRTMAGNVMGMVSRSIDAYVHQDEALAREVIASDDAVDACFDDVRDHLIKVLQSPAFRQATAAADDADDTVDGGAASAFSRAADPVSEGSRHQNAPGEQILDLLMIAKYLERIGDHAVRIAGWVLFSITGSRT